MAAGAATCRGPPSRLHDGTVPAGVAGRFAAQRLTSQAVSEQAGSESEQAGSGSVSVPDHPSGSAAPSAAPSEAASAGAIRGASVTVIGIGADGWDGLSPAARRALAAARVILGSRRQLDLLPEPGAPAEPGAAAVVVGRRIPWPSPLLPALPGLLAEHGVLPVDVGARADPAPSASPAGTAGLPGGAARSPSEVSVLASGDPMFYGIGTTLVRLLGADRVRVLPHPSSVSLACARLGWAREEVDVVSAVGRPLERVRAVLADRRRLLVLSADRDTPGALADLLVDAGYPGSELTVLDRLGAADEARQWATAADWARARAGWREAGVAGVPASDPGLRPPSDLNVVAVEPRADHPSGHRARTPGLPEEVFEHDGQITKREIRALTLARLAPAPGELLWDVGSGSGSVAIEWMRSHESCRAIAVEVRADRADRIRRNAAALGVAPLRVVVGRAPGALAGLPVPDAVFIGGGVTGQGVLDACWAALRGRGRLVVNAVTLEAEAVLAAWYARRGGDLVRIAVSRAGAVGGFTGWRPAMPVTQWTVWPAEHAAGRGES